MKRIRIVQLIEILLVLMYVALILSDLVYGLLGESRDTILSIVLAIISISLIHKGVLLKSQSTLWFSMSLVLFAITIISCQLLGVEPVGYYFIFALIPIISSIMNIAIFNNLFYIKVIILNISIAVPIVIMYFTRIELWYIVGIGVLSIVIGMIICRLLSFKKEKI